MIEARITTAISVPKGISNTKPSCASGRDTIAAVTGLFSTAPHPRS
jgi:hypothetical protein